MVESKEFMESSADVNLAKEKTPLSRHEVEESPFTVVGNNGSGS